MAVQLYKLPISAPPKPINPISRPIKMLTTNTISVTSQASSTEKVLSKRKLPILLFDIMDTIVRDPFYHDVPEFFRGYSDDSGDGFLVSSLSDLDRVVRGFVQLIWKISTASVGIRACFSVIGEIMPPKRNQQRIEEVTINRVIDQLLDRHMDRILPFERTDSVGSAGRRRDSHHGSREFVRWGSEDLRRPSGHSKQGGYKLSSKESSRGFAPSRAGKRSAEEESGFRPSALRGGDGKYYARGGRATKGSFSQRDWRGGHGSEQGHQHDVTVQTPVHEFDDSGSKATPRKRLVKKSGDRERTPDFGIEDEEPAFMRDEFASEPPSSQKRKGSKEDGFRKKEKKLKGDKKFDKGEKMSSKGGSLSAIYPGRDREMKELWDTVAGADSEDDQESVRTMDDDNFIDDTGVDPLTGYGVSYNPQAEVLWPRGAKESGSAVRLTPLERSRASRELAKIFFKDCRPLDLEGLKNCMKRGYSYMGGVEALLKDLKENSYEMHAFTNYPDWYMMIEDKLKVSTYMSWTFCSCMTDIAVKQECKRKPNADAYLEVLRRLEVDPGNCIFIDDRMTNVEAAQNVGILGIQFKDAASLRRELSNMGVETCSKNEDALNTS
ncbi:hypothetical protein Syun_030287 [Stephania yunnanensis]|uniref:Uncharacterized protein n=1 Tax=Stephania yunnanensis TaxID=152371 RepID=A0AAP0EES0_9MAGN